MLKNRLFFKNHNLNFIDIFLNLMLEKHIQSQYNVKIDAESEFLVSFFRPNFRSVKNSEH
jgi:hypothetical protein